MHREFRVQTAQPRNEVIFERANLSFSDVTAVKSAGRELVVDSLGGKEILKDFRTLIIQAL